MSDIEIVQTTLTQFDKVSAGIAALQQQYGGLIFEVTTTKGMEEAKKARSAVRDPRLEVERLRKAAKAPLLAIGRNLDKEASRITGELEKIEGPIHSQIATEEARKEAEREAKVLAEQRRVEIIQARISEIQSTAIHATVLDSGMLSQLCLKADSMAIDPAIFQEFAPKAEEALTVTRAALAGLLVKRKDQDKREAELEEQRVEYAKLKAAELERQALAHIEQNRKEAEARAERDAEAARQVEANRIERERIAQEAADAKAARIAEAREHAAKIAAERAENDRAAAARQAELDAQAESQRATAAAETAKIVAAREALEREHTALAEAQRKQDEANKPKPEVISKSHAKRLTAMGVPSQQAILDCVAEKFKTDAGTAKGWLSVYSWKSEERKSA